MQRLIDLQKSLKSLNTDYLIKLLFLDEGFKQLIINLNRKNQLFEKGIDSSGRVLRSEFARFGNVYATSTIIIKEQKNQPTDRVTLKDSGDFYSSFKVELTNNSDLLITANTLKTDNDLLKVWGDDILGLTDESLQIVINAAREIIIPIIKNILLGGKLAA